MLTAGVDARADGSGFVRAAVGLDEEALRELGDPARELRLEDLRQSGWHVSGPGREKDGLTWVRLAKPFSSPRQASEVAAELSGPDGPFREFRVQRTRSFLKTRTRFSGLVDLSNGLAGLSDAGVQEKVGDVSLGLGLDELRGRFGADVDDRVQVRVEAHLPGDVTSNATSRDGRAVVWQPQLGEQLRLQAASEALNLRPILAAVAALVFAAAALVLVARSRRPPRLRQP